MELRGVDGVGAMSAGSRLSSDDDDDDVAGIIDVSGDDDES